MTQAQAIMGGKRILIVEDDYFIAKGLARDLHRAGAEVVGPAPSVADALKLAEAEPLDGAVLDVNLRGEMAYSVGDLLRERGVPFVFTTGYGADVLPERYGGVARCEKPVRSEELCTALFGRRG